MIKVIIGIGHDIADMDRFESILNGQASERFMDKILTGQERELARRYEGQRLVQFVAGRFAVKEAVVKAIGCGIGGKVGFSDIEVLPDAAGKPECRLSGGAWDRIGYHPSITAIHVTITHDRSLASAVAVLERRD